MKRYLPFLIVGIVAIATVTGGVLLYRARPPAPLAKKEPAKAQEGSVHSLGPVDAAVTLEEFGDFQCPPCGMLSQPLNDLLRDFPRLRLVFKNFPLAMHQHANEAALAAEAAGLQGQFWRMHDLLYREQAAWSKAPDARVLFEAYAAMIKCNVTRFKKDMASDEVSARVRADQAEGTKLGVTNTPTIFLNNTAVPVANLNPSDLRDAITKALKEKEGKPSSGG
jgi:protein-disulfide isomerase